MINMCFYDKYGNSISAEKFIEEYSKCYFISNSYDNNFNVHVNRSSCQVEKEICSILSNGIKNNLDVKKILAWKIGKIKHIDSDNTNEIIYASDWQDSGDLCVKRYGNDMDLTKLADFICNSFDDLRKTSFDNPQGVLNKLNNKSIKGIGSVYLITLLFFISGGKYPIYDRFADAALQAIINDKNPKESEKSIHPVELPDRSSKGFKTLLCNESSVYKRYIENLYSVFENDYKVTQDLKKARNIDRALWVYGHIFYKKK